MKIFLTGGTGFIGSHVLKQLLASDIEVVAHRRKESASPNIPIDRTVNWLTKPVSDIEPLDFAGVDVLLHLASHSVQYPFDTLENNIHYNVVEPLEMFEKAFQAGVSKYVVAGSCFEYGLSGERYKYIPADAPLEPTNDYATSKAMSFLAFKQFALSRNISLSYHRIFHVFGEGESENRLWPSLKKAALAGKDFDLTQGEQIRDFCGVQDIASKLVYSVKKISTTENMNVYIDNLGSGSEMRLKDFVALWWKKWCAKGKLNFGKMPYRQGENMRLVPETNRGIFIK